MADNSNWFSEAEEGGGLIRLVYGTCLMYKKMLLLIV